MTNTYTLSNSLNPVFEQALLRVTNAVSPLGVPYFIAGATARDIVLHGIFGMNRFELRRTLIPHYWCPVGRSLRRSNKGF